ncbi:MAG TPA: DUF6295 family protein [Alphaproteobacteria bacterium]|nr:DUF6295 family protein [Alphaproteobacteria bacterium]
MCTMITTQAKISGSGKGPNGWFDLREVNVGYDHPFHIPLEHALTIDFVNEAAGPGARVAVELTPESARDLVKAILTALEKAEAGGWIEEAHGSGHR